MCQSSVGYHLIGTEGKLRHSLQHVSLLWPLFLLKVSFIFVCVGQGDRGCTHTCRRLGRQEGVLDSLGAGVTGSYESPDRGPGNSILGPFDEQQTVLTSEPFLQLTIII